MEPGLDTTQVQNPAGATFPNGCHIAEVEIDPDSGVTTILRYTIVDDFGDVINPMLLEGQVHGGVVQGIGQALLEETVYDAEGQLLTGTFMDYAMPRADDLPFFSFTTRNVRCKANPLGIKGAGEAGAIGAPPALINAIVDALHHKGVRHIDMPATPKRVWEALHAARLSRSGACPVRRECVTRPVVKGISLTCARLSAACTLATVDWFSLDYQWLFWQAVATHRRHQQVEMRHAGGSLVDNNQAGRDGQAPATFDPPTLKASAGDVVSWNNATQEPAPDLAAHRRAGPFSADADRSERPVAADRARRSKSRVDDSAVGRADLLLRLRARLQNRQQQSSRLDRDRHDHHVSRHSEDAMLCDGMLALRGRAMLSFSGALIAAAFFCAPSAHAQLPALPGGPVDCPAANQPLVRIPEIVSDSGKLAGTLTLITAKQRLNLAGTNCLDQYVRQFTGGTVVPNYPGTNVPVPAPPGGYYDPVPAPTLRAKLGDIVQLTFLNQVVVGPWWQSMDRGEKGQGCDNNASVPYPGPDQFPDCFHGSSTGNIHFHGTHTNPNSTGDNVFIEVRPSPQKSVQNVSPTVTAASVQKPFTEFFANCTTELNKSVLSQWPTKWADLPKSWRDEQEKLLKAYDANPTIVRKLWPVNAAQIKEGAWPQFYIGAYPYCFRIPPYTAQGFPSGPAVPASHGPNQGRRTLQMGQAPGTHWYHAHKHGSTTINVSNGMTGVFIIEGKYDDELNKYYGAGWTRRQPVMVINELGTVPNLFAGSGGHPPISINGRVMPKVTMQPGEVQMWRIANTSSRSGVFLAGISPVPAGMSPIPPSPPTRRPP